MRNKHAFRPVNIGHAHYYRLLSQRAFVLTLLALFGATQSSSKIRAQSREDNRNREIITHLDEIIRIVARHQVDRQSEAALRQSVVDGLFQKLDPHTFYQTAPETQRENTIFHNVSELEIGIDVTHWYGGTVVQSVRHGSPADNVGMLPGDRLLQVEDEVADSLPVRDIEHARSTRTSGKIEYTALRPGSSKIFHFLVTPRNASQMDEASGFILTDHIGYVRFSVFNDSSAHQIAHLLAALQHQGMNKLILDLRDNGGGLLSVCCDIARLFLKHGDTIVTTEAVGAPRKAEVQMGNPVYGSLPIIILTNSSSASASEVLAGTLQDHDRALIIGEPSYGKGLMQNLFGLEGGAQMHVTVSRIYLPSGRCVQRPYANGKYEYARPSWLSGPNYDHSADSQTVHGAEYRTEKGRTVYAGEGIVPEVIVAETAPEALLLLWSNHSIQLPAAKYIFAHAEHLRSKFSSEEIWTDFRTPSELMDSILTGQPPLPEDSLAQDKKWITNQLKLCFAWALYGDTNPPVVYLEQEEIIQKAERNFDKAIAMVE